MNVRYVLVFLWTIIGVTSHAAQDSAPKGPLPVKFKKITPKNAPLSRYGNPDSYAVDGKVYHVMTSATGYRVRGLASWYGTKFHSHRTSSGEKYNMYALTAAHKTLPLPSYIRVKNLNNGKVAILKVNDRGPFHTGRVLDLSYGSAVKLGLFPRGTAMIEIEALATRNQVAHYYLQAGAFSSAALANAMQKKLAAITPSPVFIQRYQHNYLVRVGPFANQKMTVQLKKKLAQKGVSGSFSLLM
jgi:rare lipoprotein A